jgi:capsular polysaccharide transport system permease protein
MKLTLRTRFLLFVGLPTLLALVYFAFVATDMYVSEAQFSIRGAEGGSGPEWLALFGHAGGSTTADAYVVQEYIQSQDMLTVLEQNLSLRVHYQSRAADVISRLESEATREEFLNYFRGVVGVEYDPASGIFTLQTRAYSPEMARDLCQAILAQSEELVNQLAERSLQDSLALARNELAVAEERVTKARESMKHFRNQQDLLNPEAVAGAMLALVAELEGEAVKTRTTLSEVRTYMREDSARITALKARLAALEGQISAEKGRLTGNKGHVLNEVVTDYERLQVEREFAEKLYLSALASLEAARVRAESKSRYLVAFAEPTLPDESLYPRRIRSTGLFFAITTLLFGIVSLIIAAIREHAGF